MSVLDTPDPIVDPERLFEGFENLMPFRVQDILLVSSLYDSFILREDGRLNELLIGESLELEQQQIPGITHVSSGAEALKLVHEVNHPGAKMIIDYYHMRTENEDPEIVRTAKEHIVHMHFANPAGRRWPHSADEDPVYAKFFQIVKEINYQGGISIEGTGSFDADGEASLAFFKSELA